MGKDFFKINEGTGLAQAFERFKTETFPRYKGCLIEKVRGGFKWGGRTYSTIEETKSAIDHAYKNFGNNLRK